MPVTTTDLAIARTLLSVMPLFTRLIVTKARERDIVSPERARTLVRLAAGPMRSGELAQQCMLTPSSITELVEGLVRDGLVRRVEDASDRRVVIVSLTPAGRRQADRYEAVLADLLGEVLARLQPAARERLRLTLVDLQRVLDEEVTAKEVAGAR